MATPTRLELSFLTVLLVLGILSLPAQAATVRATIYDDGLSCPANCDAHVVFAPSLNGTANAHTPASADGPFKKCISGNECRICFDSTPASCMLAMYRGNGPHANTFDFTPAFYEANCSKPDIPAALAEQCRSLARSARGLDGRVNCVRTPEHARCVEVIRVAREKQERDRPIYQECVRLGEAAFNRGRPVTEQRSEACAYEKKGTGGPNSRGKTWRRLLPGACRDGTFVGRDGTDCCTGNPLADGPLGVECKAFYPQP